MLVHYCFLLFLLQSGKVQSHPSAWEINLKSNLTLYGDMVLTPRQRSRYENPFLPIRHVYRKENSVNRWTNNIVPYTLSSQYSSSQANTLRQSLKSLERVTCFKFVERTTQRDYLDIQPLDGCYSFVGKIGGKQLMSLAVDCIADYIIWHEMMHALGMEHEHQRPDRDQWIRVEYSNVQPGQMVNFEKIRPDEVDYPDRYDYKSIMHYDGYAFGKIEGGRRLATMIPLKSGITLLDNMQLSQMDIDKLNRLGKCSTKSSGKIESEPINQGECKDNPAANCGQMVAVCGLEVYRQLMISQCPKTCGKCAFRDQCADLDVRCANYAANGFCTNQAYGNEPRTRCPKTCGFC